jgi:hypothetical protein
MNGHIVGLAMAMLILATALAAQEASLSGELRPRFEVRDPVGALGTVEFTSMRSRVSLQVALEHGLTAFFQLQDVRTFGEEASTLDGSANGLDLHQGWIEMGDPATDRWSLRVGRQEAAYGGERLVGVVNWAQQARSFDGARTRFRPSPDVVVDGLAFRVSDALASGTGVDESLYGIYSTMEARGTLDLFALWSAREQPAGARDLVTLGGRWAAGQGPLRWRVETAYQTGDAEGPLGTSRDIAAFMLGARVGTRINDDIGATLWYDYLSGDDDPGDDVIRTFDTMFATNHKFYGYMDFFVDIPASTNGRGLHDLALKGTYDVRDGHTLAADLHMFRLAAADGLDAARIGEELDITYRWAYAPGVTVTGGLSYFLAADAWSAGLGNPDENQVWGYVMLDVTF